jgi:hypothetical protein
MIRYMINDLDSTSTLLSIASSQTITGRSMHVYVAYLVNYSKPDSRSIFVFVIFHPLDTFRSHILMALRIT